MALRPSATSRLPPGTLSSRNSAAAAHLSRKKSYSMRTFFTRFFRMTLRILFCCSISREMFSGRSSLSTTPAGGGEGMSRTLFLGTSGLKFCGIDVEGQVLAVNHACGWECRADHHALRADATLDEEATSEHLVNRSSTLSCT